MPPVEFVLSSRDQRKVEYGIDNVSSVTEQNGHNVVSSVTEQNGHNVYLFLLNLNYILEG